MTKEEASKLEEEAKARLEIDSQDWIKAMSGDESIDLDAAILKAQAAMDAYSKIVTLTILMDAQAAVDKDEEERRTQIW